MILDTSALLAILFDEPEGPQFLMQIVEAPLRVISAANMVEAWMVTDRHSNRAKATALDELVKLLEVEVRSVDLVQARVARRAFEKYGKGKHPAGLNFGDCFAYALTQVSGDKLLFKGGDFSHTDIAKA